MIKNLYDGTKAIAMFNKEHLPVEVYVNWDESGLKGKQQLRNVLRHKNLDTFKNEF